MPDKAVEILESVNNNNGASTMNKSVLTTGATVFPHYYTLLVKPLKH